jgi:hypothetical protein
MTQATATNSRDNTSRNGVVLVVDSILAGPLPDFWSKNAEYLEKVHTGEKLVFFKLLSNETLKRYEPEY